MYISVIICTWNRADLLDQTLRRMHALEAPEGVDWELLVVNNHSTDTTDAVLEQHAGALPLRRLFEPTPGKSHALNRVVGEARGRWLVFTDDDVFVEPGWLAAYTEAFQRWPEAGFFGGPVHPHFEGTPPAWLTVAWEKAAHAFATRDFGPNPFRLDNERIPFGANMAVRRDCQLHYLYDPSLGPRPGSELRGEETTMMRQMLRDGIEGRWVPGARVGHFVSKERQTRRFLRAFSRGAGQFQGRRFVEGLALPRALYRVAYLMGRVPLAELHYQTARLTRGPEHWVELLMVAGKMQGMLPSALQVLGQTLHGATNGRGAQGQ